MSNQEQLASAVAAAFVSHGCSVARMNVDNGMPTIAVGKAGHNLVVYLTETGRPMTDQQRKWTDAWHGQLAGCSGRGHAAAIADALRDGEFEGDLE